MWKVKGFWSAESFCTVSYETVQKLSADQKPLTFHKASVYLFQEDDRPGQYCLSEAMFEDDGIDIYYCEIKG